MDQQAARRLYDALYDMDEASEMITRLRMAKKGDDGDFDKIWNDFASVRDPVEREKMVKRALDDAVRALFWLAPKSSAHSRTTARRSKTGSRNWTRRMTKSESAPRGSETKVTM